MRAMRITHPEIVCALRFFLAVAVGGAFGALVALASGMK